MDAEQFRKALVTDMLLEGAGYAYIDKSGNRITGLYYVEGQYVNLVDGADKIKKSVDVYLNGKKVRDFDVIRITKDTIDGIHGIGVLDSHSLLFSTMYNALKYENTAVASGTKRGFLKSARRYAAYDTGIKSGWLQVDEVRKIEKMAPIGFEFMKLSLADVFYNPKTKEIFVPNTNGTGNIAKAGKEGNE